MQSSSSLIFPSIWTLPMTRTTLLIDRLKVDQHHEALRLIGDAAKRGDNIGVDEVHSMSTLEFWLEFTDVGLTFCDLTTKNMECLILITSCRYIRSSHPAVCSFFMATSKEYASKIFWREFLQIAERVTTSLTPWYSACSVDVFVACTQFMLACREEGFIITAWVPDAGKLEGYPGYCSSYIMYKDFGIPDVPKQISSGDDEVNDDEVDLSSVNLAQVKALPLNYVLRSGLEITVRTLRRDEIRLFYRTLKSAVDHNIGYGLDELPNLAYFVRWYVDRWYNMVYEVTSSKEIIAFANFGPSCFSRGLTSRLGDGNVIIVDKFRGQRLSVEILAINTSYSEDEGVHGVFGETSITNLPSLKSFLDGGGIVTGSIPKGIFFKDRGWVDLVTHYMSPATLANRQNPKLSAKL